uniref:AP complex mu/sigma subunit domain-containing protein n=1 Tax=Falco tinnunculus TaxID=100819 RepID=A0A8C4TSX0_FALTI
MRYTGASASLLQTSDISLIRKKFALNVVQNTLNLKRFQIMFNLDRVHIILDEMVLNGCIVETNRNRILAPLLNKITPSQPNGLTLYSGQILCTQG